MTDRPEDLPALIKRIKDERNVSESEIARRIEVSPAAVNSWVHRKRGTGRGPNPDILRRLAHEFNIPERVVFDAAGRKAPGPVGPDAEARILQLYRGLTAQQQGWVEIQLRAVVADNQINGIDPIGDEA